MKVIKTAKYQQSYLGIIIGIHCCLLTFLMIFRLNYDTFVFQTEPLIYPFCCLLFGLTIWSFLSWYILTKSLFNPYLLFFLSASLFNGGQAMLEVFHLNEDGMLANLDIFYDFSSTNILNTIFFVTISLASLHLGALLCLVSSPINIPESNSQKNSLISTTNTTYITGKRLLFISILPTFISLKNSLSIVLTSGYSGLFEEDNFFSSTGVSATPDILAAFLVPASLFMLAGSQENRQGRLISGTIIVFYAMIRFLLGQRNTAVMALISFAWVWNQLIRPIPKTLLISLSFLMLFIIFPLIAATRNTVGQERFSLDFLVQTFSSINNPAIAAISEMGGSMLTVACIMGLVPSDKEFQMGADYFYAFLTLIPNIFGKVHPTIARGLSTQWLTEQINPYFAAVGGSYGFSFIAEAYLNFGWLGAPIALGVLGFLFVKLMLWATRYNHPAKIAMVGSFLSSFLFYARAESALMVRPLVWYSFLPYLLVLVLNYSRSKRLAR